MKILNFGSANLDYVYSLDHIVEEGETEQSDAMHIFAGGKGLNQSVAAARAGAEIFHAGCVGSDGDMLISILADSGADVSLIKRENAKNGHAVIQVGKNGENSIFIHSGTNAMIDRPYVDSVLSHFGKGDILILQNEISSIDYIIDAAYKKGMFIILNPSPMNEKILQLDFNKISCLVANEVETKAIFNTGEIKALVKTAALRYPGMKIVLTRGVKGSVFIDGENVTVQNAFSVNAVDTTAAGDAFMGYFVAGLAANEDIEKVLRTASAASAIAVSRAGAAPSIPCRNEVAEKIGSMKELVIADRENTFKSKIEKYVSDNLSSATLAGLAEAFNCSCYAMQGIIKECTGVSFVKYVQALRLREAARLLADSDMPISEITHSVGYENESFFRKMFKASYGMTLKDYRKKEKLK